MRITVIAVGTRGDVQPLLALAEGLHLAGHQVRFATENGYSAAVIAAGLEHYPLRGNSQAFYSGRAATRYREIMARPDAQEIYNKYSKTYAGSIALNYARRNLQEIVAPCEGADALICQPTFGVGPSLADKFAIPAIVASLLPAHQTKAFPNPFDPIASDRTAEENWQSWDLMTEFTELGHSMIQEWRTGFLGLEAQSFAESLRQMRSLPHVLGYSSLVVPKPSEWGAHVAVTGYWFRSSSADYAPTAELEQFLREGEAPVVVGFGSHVGRDPAQLTRVVVDALRLAGQRGVLIRGLGGLRTDGLPQGVFSVTEVPYEWLLARSSALVHHGGAGTTASALRMGVPQVIVPFGWDQPFWGHRCARLGVSAEPLPAKAVTVEALAAAITSVTTHSNLRARAASLAQSIQSERGVTTAITKIERFAGI
jgi:UDP:flavonoid glycosyltransferase YjiC (YdhE family)